MTPEQVAERPCGCDGTPHYQGVPSAERRICGVQSRQEYAREYAAQVLRETEAKIAKAKAGTSRDSFYDEDHGDDNGYVDYVGGLDDAAEIVRARADQEAKA